MRKILVYSGFILLLLLIAGVAWHISYLRALNTKHSYPADTYLANCHKKEAIIIVAHDDDAVSCAGTIARLTAAGWNVREFCFYGYSMSEGDTARQKIRKESTKKVRDIEGLKAFNWFDLDLRKKPALKPPLSIPYAAFDSVYRFDTVEAIIASLLYKYRPTVIFTLDDSIGGYGHSDHVFISKAIMNVCRKERNNPGFTVEKIYQPVFPRDMADNILIKHRVTQNSFYETAEKTYPCNGMPIPDVQIHIADQGSIKKDIMNSYPTEKHNFTKFWQGYNWYPAWFYFGIFDREFFRVVDVKK